MAAERDGGDDIVAAEYVLHLLGPDDRRQADARLEVDGGFRARVARWSEHFVALAENIAPVAPPAAVRARLEDYIRERRETAQAATRAGWRPRFGRGPIAAGLAAIVAVALLALYLPLGIWDTPDERYSADIRADEIELAVQAVYDPAEATLTVTRESGVTPDGRALQVWLLTEDQPPHAVGILPEEAELVVPVIPFWGQRIPSGQFAVSDEPPGGSNDEVGPTGPILAVGEVDQQP